MNVIESHENELAKTKLVNLQLETCKEIFALLHPHFPLAALGALIASETTGSKPAPVRGPFAHYVCIFATVSTTSTSNFILHRGQQTATRMLCKGNHGANPFDATNILLMELRAQLGVRFRNCWKYSGHAGPADDPCRRYIQDANIDRVEVDGTGLDASEVEDGNVDRPDIDNMNVVSAHNSESQSRGSTGEDRAGNSTSNAPAPISQPPPPSAEDDSTSTPSEP